MPLKGFVEHARKTNQLIEQKTIRNTNNIIDISDGAFPKQKIEEMKQNYPLEKKNNHLENFSQNIQPKTNFEKEYLKRQNLEKKMCENTIVFKKQKIDERHGNIIANVIKNSNDVGQKTNWENCKHKKNCEGTIYCTEFHSLCGKDRCNRATK